MDEQMGAMVKSRDTVSVEAYIHTMKSVIEEIREHGLPVSDICNKLDMGRTTFYKNCKYNSFTVEQVLILIKIRDSVKI